VTYRRILPWQVIESRKLLDKQWLELYEERVRLGNGHEIAEFHRIVAPSWAATLCLTESDEVVLVRQYRHGISKESVELPAGVLEPGEPPLQAAQRELREETGYVADEWHSIATFATEPSRHTVHAHFFCALGARAAGERSPEASEDIELVKVPRASLLSLCESGGIVHGVHIGAILLAARRGLLSRDPRAP
jgi:8-oxo-dGTP pyrophosphatase MutT (NUDIX family)